MLTNDFKIFDGKSIFLEEIIIKVLNNKNMILLNIDFQGDGYLLLCENVSSLSFSDIYLPIDIDLAIIDNKQNGWEDSVRYHIYDYEEGRINFYCSDIHVL